MHALLYRLFRLRRLICVAMLLPMLSVAIVYLLKGPVALALAPIAVLVPVAHVLWYPNAWMETLPVSISLSFVLILGGMIGPDVGLLGLALRLSGIAVLGGLLVLAFSTVLIGAISAGPAQPITTRARRWSRLSPEALKRAVTLYPGREDDKITCGPANDEGVFEVTMHLDGPTFACAMRDEGADFDVHVDLEDEADIQAAMAEMSAQLQEIGAEDIEISFEAAPPDEGAHDLHLIGIVSHSDATSHDVIVLDESTRETTATRMTFTPKGKGTLVTMEERSAPMPRGFALGFWLQDYGTDYLIDEIDRAEGRTLRANRSAGQASLLEDIALRLTSREEPVTPAE